MNRLKEKYLKEIRAQLKKDLALGNDLAVPRLEKIVLNVGLGKGLTDAKFKETVLNTLVRITGQKPVTTLAKKAISNFKIKQGMVVGAKVTLRGERMYDFLDKMINIALPRVRDFRGISPRSVDQKGNLNIGFKENIVFPEIKSDEVEHLHGLEVAVITTAGNKENGRKLFNLLGLPFFKEDNKIRK